MLKEKMQVKVTPNAAGGIMTTGEGEHPFISRLFANDQWREVSLQDQKGIGGLPLEIKWKLETLNPAGFHSKQR